jgi:transcription termination factor NusB
MVSRRRSREFLVQSLYSRTELKSSFSRDSFIEAYFDESGVDYLELPYVDTMEQSIIAHEAELIGLIGRLAPKFELATIPVMHILILMISLTEMLYEK